MNAEQMRECILPTRDANNGTACMNCMQYDRNLVACSACRCAKYCGKDCQAADWKKSHKKVCKIIKSFRTFAKGMQDARGGEEVHWNVKYSVGYKFDRCFRKKADEGSESRSSLDLPRGTISETSWTRAKNLALQSPCCSICRRCDFSYDPDDSFRPEWKCCPRCKQGWCCSEEHTTTYREFHTREICDTYLRASSIDLFRHQHILNHGDTFRYCPVMNPEQKTLTVPLLARFPNGWHEYFMTRAPIDYGTKRHRLPDEFFPASTKELSQPLTCLYGMHQHDSDFFMTTKKLTIHVVGANPSFEMEGGAPTMVWEEIEHCLPAVMTTNTVFVGPEVTLNMSLRLVKSCPECESKGRTRMQAFYKMTYKDYREGKEFIKPDLVVAFNTGMHEEDTDSWKESLEVMLALDVPCIFTSFNKHDAECDFKVLTEVKARKLTDAPVPNPFSVNIPAVDDAGCVDSFFQPSMYCICFKGFTDST